MMERCSQTWGLTNNCWPPNSDKPLVMFVDDNSYTHAVIVNATTPTLKPEITKDKVLGLAYEPLELLCPGDPNFRKIVQERILPAIIDSRFYEYAKKHIGEYFVGHENKLPTDLFTPFYGFMFTDTTGWQENVKRERKKTKTMSLILSQKRFLPGHQYRYALAQLILETKLDIDIWGYGADNFKDTRAKGSFKDTEPYDDYLYTIVIENTVSDHYFSEKIINPISCDCIPIYLGARNCKNYLGPDSCYELTGELIADFNKIITIATDPQMYLLSLKGAQQEVETGAACFPRLVAERWAQDDLEEVD